MAEKMKQMKLVGGLGTEPLKQTNEQSHRQLDATRAVTQYLSYFLNYL